MYIRVHDFIAGTTIALGRPLDDRFVADEPWDIVRSNDAASDLVLRHSQVLGQLHTGSTQDPAIH